MSRENAVKLKQFVFYVNNLTLSVIDTSLNACTLCIFYKSSNLFDSFPRPPFKQGKIILVFQHYFLLLTEVFCLFAFTGQFCFFLFRFNLIFVILGYLFLVLLQFSYVR